MSANTFAVKSFFGPDSKVGPDGVVLDAPWFPYQMILLDRTWIPQMLALQDAAGDNQIIRKTEAELENHFATGQWALGMVKDGRLIGQGIIKNELVKGSALNFTFNHAAQHDTFKRSTLGCVMIHPEFRGHNLMESLVSMWMLSLERNDFDFAHCRVKVDNVGSWKNFLNKGMIITGVGASPDDASRTVYTLHKPINVQMQFDDASAKDVMLSRTQHLRNQLEQGYVATKWNPSYRSMDIVRCTGLSKKKDNIEAPPALRIAS